MLNSLNRIFEKDKILFSFNEEDITKLDEKMWLEILESEIKSYLRKYKHWNYNDEEIQYLFEFSDFCQFEED